MAVDWNQTTLGEVIELKRGYDLPTNHRREGSYPVVSSSGISGWHDQAKVSGPGVATGRYGTIGEVFFIKEDFWPLNTALYVRNFKGNDPRFISYFLRAFDFFVYSDKAAVPGLNRNHLHTAIVRVPPPSEQRAIAHILGTLDDKIELNRRMSETLEGIARAIFKLWFVHFNPVRAKAEDRDTGLPRHIADLFPHSLVDSELGEIPKGWEVKTVGDLADVVGGSTPSTKEPDYWDNGTHHWATPKDLSTLKMPVLLTTERCITDTGLAQISSGLLPMGTILLSSRAPIGYLAIAEVPAAINQGFIAMKPKKSVSNLFLLFWTKFAHDDILSRANGSTFLEISKANFRPIGLVEPSPKVMQAFDQLARPLYKRIVENERESHILATLSNTLLPMLISGELRVKNAERILGRAL